MKSGSGPRAAPIGKPAARDRGQVAAEVLTRLPHAVVVVDRQLTVHYANPAADRLLGDRIRSGSALPETWPHFSLRDFAAGLFGADPPDAALVTVAGRSFSVEGLPAGGGDNAVLILADVTERERRRRVDREFVENAAHELQTPLAAIMSVIEVLETGAKDVPETRDRFLKHLRAHSDRLVRLSSSLLALARVQGGLEEPRVELIELKPMLLAIAETLDPFSTLTVAVDASDDIAALADPQLLQGALSNLAENAIKHAAAGQVVLAARSRGEEVEIEIRDTGPGMTANEVARAFDRFYRRPETTAEGFGLGLAIADESVRVLGGTITLASNPGVGTRALVTVPGATIIS